MNSKEKLLQEIEQSPDFIIDEILNFLLFIRARYAQKQSESRSKILEKNQMNPC